MADSQPILPPLQDVLESTEGRNTPLAHALSLLFEPSEILFTKLVPALASPKSAIKSFTELIDAASQEIKEWDRDTCAKFISGHPRIGESRNISPLSAKEQGAASLTANATPPEVLARLAHLNACYEYAYPGLRYITFVNGRSRTAIALEMEEVLGFAHSLSSVEPAVSTVKQTKPGDDEWISELHRAVHDVGRIAKSRLTTLESASCASLCT